MSKTLRQQNERERFKIRRDWSRQGTKRSVYRRVTFVTVLSKPPRKALRLHESGRSPIAGPPHSPGKLQLSRRPLTNKLRRRPIQFINREPPGLLVSP